MADKKTIDWEAIEQHSQLATLERVVSSHMDQARAEKAK